MEEKEYICDSCFETFSDSEFAGHCPACGEDDKSKIFAVNEGPDNFYQPAIVLCEGCGRLYGPRTFINFPACSFCGAGLQKIHTLSTVS